MRVVVLVCSKWERFIASVESRKGTALFSHVRTRDASYKTRYFRSRARASFCLSFSSSARAPELPPVAPFILRSTAFLQGRAGAGGGGERVYQTEGEQWRSITSS